MDKTILLVNFGGPRDLSEVESFLTELLSDQELLRTHLPKKLHRFIFSYIAKKRAVRIRKEYEKIGGKSPIYFDTEAIASFLRETSGKKVITFHRYLKSTHQNTLDEIEKVDGEIVVFPFFPQFSFATTGSSQKFFEESLSQNSLEKMKWIPSYGSNPYFINAYTQLIQNCLKKNNLKEENVILLFSAHGLPASFIKRGDTYQKECEASYRLCMDHFPKAEGILSYQSKFGPGKWLTPSTQEVCEKGILDEKKSLIFVPISFTSDHIETLFEIAKIYKPLIEERKMSAYLCPALNQETVWLDAITNILNPETTVESGK